MSSKHAYHDMPVKNVGLPEIPYFEPEGKIPVHLWELAASTSGDIWGHTLRPVVWDRLKKHVAYRHLPPDIVELVSLAGFSRQLINFQYTGKTGVSKRYLAEPYSFRYRGEVVLFYAYDVDDDHIKSFYLHGLSKVKIRRERFAPRWRITLFYKRGRKKGIVEHGWDLQEDWKTEK